MHPCLKHIRALLSVILAAADVVSDIILAVNYGVNGYTWRCGLTWLFIAIPIVVGIGLICKAFWITKRERLEMVLYGSKAMETCGDIF